ncbi:hypothetical protein [Streptomyces sp. IBSBF 2435]|uniref:hypothetical protein n=1 Tax=Streptomyces sp. IBSBF 2435 TaxID=2903531 RepID=UPI002FDBA58B
MDRRDALKLSALASATGILTLTPVNFAAASDKSSSPGQDGDLKRIVTGHLPTGAADFVYLPVEVPRGMRQIAVSYTYDRPAVPYGTNLAGQWKFGYDDVDAIEVWNGPWASDDEASLLTWDNLLTGAVRRGDGHWIPAMGNSDAHRDPDVVGLPQAVVPADGPNRRALQAGIRAGRPWIAENAEVQLAFTASGRTASTRASATGCPSHPTPW